MLLKGKKRILMWIFFSIFLHIMVRDVSSQEIISVQNISIKPYNDTLKAFEAAYGNDISLKIVISEMDQDTIIPQIRRNRPDMILAIGASALNKILTIQDIPIVYVMVQNPEPITRDRRNITGVTMNLPPEEYFASFKKAILNRKIKTIGIVFNPANSASYIQKAQIAASQAEITLITKPVDNPKQVIPQVKKMKTEIDALWMIPDQTVINTETVEYFTLFSLENNIPLLSFAEKYVAIGALMALSINESDMGIQVCEMAKKILSGTDIQNVVQSDARNGKISYNENVARKLGIDIDPNVKKKAKKFPPKKQ